MEIEILSLFPEYFSGPFDESILKRAREKGLLTIRHVHLRDFAKDKHRRVDDRPYGGGPGMVLKPEPVLSAIRSVKRAESHVVYLSARGGLLTAAKCRSLAKQHRHLILLCGHYEGVDERVIEEAVDEEISIGDYVLTNGALAAIVLIDAVARFIPGVLGHPEAADEDSFERGLLEGPHYTRPANFEGKEIPEVLVNGDHKKIAQWKEEMALKQTLSMRPDLYERKFKHKETNHGCLDR
jgi:tRNA (guanine37-N1)-methyltransferase